MPLLPLPASNTKRYFMVYTVGSFTHRIQVRANVVTTDADAVANLRADFAGLITILAPNCSFTGMEVALKGSNVRNAVAGFTPFTGTAGTAAAGQMLTRTLAMRGRSPGGRKVKMLIFGIMTPGPQPNFYYNPGAGEVLRTFITSVQSRANYYWAIDEQLAVWKPDLMDDYNDHYEVRLRP